MRMSTDRMLQDIHSFSAFVQDTIGRAIEQSFGYATTPATNTLLMYLLTAILLVTAVRVCSASLGHVKTSGSSRYSDGYDFGRYG